MYSIGQLILVGGVHPSFYPVKTLNDFQAHAVAIGNAEKTIVELIKAKDADDFSQINGICYFRNGHPVVTPQESIEENLDWLPLPSRHLLTESDFIMNNRLSNTNLRMAHIMMNRGCPFSCRFCAVMQKKVQYRSAENIRLELQHLIRQYHIDGFAIVDDNFVINKANVLSICEKIRDLRMKWSALSRVDTVDYELLENMNKSGCIEIKFGIESGSEKMLAAMGKNISTAQIKKALMLAASVGIRNKIFLIHGFPGENMETTGETISLLKEIAPLVDRVSLFRFTPLPGSYVYRNAAAYNLRLAGSTSNFSEHHIYRNNHHWWGGKKAFKVMNNSYKELKRLIDDTWQNS